MAYRPDGWAIIKIEADNEIIYRIFSGWAGGYSHGDSWKLSSKIKSVVEHPDFITIGCSSGSLYELSKDGENRFTVYNFGILVDLLEKNKGDKILMSKFLEEFIPFT